MAIRLVNTAEGGTNGANVTAGSSADLGGLSGNAWNTVSGTSGTVTYSSGNFKHGARSISIAADGAGAVGVQWNENSVTPSPLTAYARFYFKLNALPATSAQWVVFQDSGGTNLIARINLRTDGKIELTDSGGTVRATSTTTLATGAWYRLEAKIFSNSSTGTFDVRLFTGGNVEGTTADETVSFSGQNTHGNAVRRAHVGAFNTVSTLAMWIDSIEYNDTGYPGPYATPVPVVYETLMANNTTYPFMQPLTNNNADTGTYTFGTVFHSTVAGKVYGAAWSNGLPATSADNGLTPQIALYNGFGGSSMATKTTTVTEVRGNWNYELFTTPVSIIANSEYVIAVFRKGYPHEEYFFDAGNGGHGTWSNAHLVAASVATTDNNYFETSGSLANPYSSTGQRFRSTWYGVDVLFQPDNNQGHWGIMLR
ncbi:MAG TPA: DUF4082 domain-containing protein [Nevskiaceae bacterium]|nr:DUF4082 domain-containing protein [Nevskiaceae bacterium]